MREILFRGKHTRTGEWVEGLLWKKKYRSDKFFISCFPDKDDNEEAFIVFSETVGQYTGLTDINGKRIFEGDICLCDRNINDHIDEKTFIVEFDPWRGWIGISKDGWSEFHGGSWECAEVIGNIHDNPELLKGGE